MTDFFFLAFKFVLTNFHLKLMWYSCLLCASIAAGMLKKCLPLCQTLSSVNHGKMIISLV